MPNSPHLSDAALLLIVSRELPKSGKAAVAEHLKECSDCAVRLRNLLEIRRGVLSLNDGDLERFTADVPETHAAHDATMSRKLRIGASIALSLLVVAGGLYLWISHPRAVSADELLTRAGEQESLKAPEMHVRIRAAGASCVTGTRLWDISAQKNSPCMRLRASLNAARWNPDKPLSSSSFQNWRRSLSSRHDTVSENTQEWDLKTETEEGGLHAASIRIRKSDYGAVAITLQFSDLSSILIEEIPASEVPLEPTSLPPTQAATPAPPIATTPIDPMDPVEVAAWTALHKARADSGWEAFVIRDSGKVVVAGMVEDANRKNEITAAMAQADPRIEVAVHTLREATAADRALLPERKFGATAPPLAEDWLEQHFPRPNERSAYASHASELSRSLLGEVFIYERLTQRYQALHSCPCEDRLEPIQVAQRQRIAELQQQLAGQMSALLDAPPKPASARLLTYKDALVLDSLVRNAVTAQSDPSLSLPVVLESLRSLL
jgi:hypothetical protein